MSKEMEVKVAIVVMLGLLLVTSTIFAMSPTWVEAKKAKSSDTNTSDSDKGSDNKDKQDKKTEINNPEHPTKEDTKDVSDIPEENGPNVHKVAGHGPANGPVSKAYEGSPHGTVVSDPNQKAYPPEVLQEQQQQQGLKPGTIVHTDKPPFTRVIGDHGIVPHKPVPPVVVKTVSITKIIIEIKARIHHSSGGSHTHTTSGTYWSNADMATLTMIWNNGIKKGQDPEIDAFMTRMLQ